MKKESPMVTRKCDCGCCMLVVQKALWDNTVGGTDVNYHISMQDSRCVGNNSLWGRVKNAFSCLFGKPVYYNDLVIDGEDEYLSLLKEMESLKDFK